MNPTVQTAPAIEPLDRDSEIKDWLSIDRDNDSDDALLTALIKSVRVATEDFTHRKLITQTLDYTLDSFPAREFIELPGGVLQSITKLDYTDSAEATVTWTSTNYFAVTDRVPGWLHLADGKSWPTVTLRPRSGILVRYVVGYGSAATDVPAPILTAMKIALADLYENREDLIVAQGLTPVALGRTRSILATHTSWSFRG